MPNAFTEVFNSGADGLTGASSFGHWVPLVTATNINFNIQGDSDLTGAGSDVLTLWVESSHENPETGADPKKYRPVYTISPVDGTRSLTLATILGNVTRSADTTAPTSLQASRYTAEDVLNRYIRIGWKVTGTAASFKNVKVLAAYETNT
jgi:hypothetical protein